MRTVFIRLMLLLVFFASILHAQTPEIVDIDQISLGEKSLSFDSPVIKQNQDLYVPVREILPIIEATMGYSSQDDQYYLTFRKQKQTLYLSQKTSEITYQQKKIKLQTPLLFYEGSLYVPINSFFHILGLKVLVQGNKISLFKGTIEKAAPATSAQLTMDVVEEGYTHILRWKTSKTLHEPRLIPLENSSGFVLEFFDASIQKSPKITLSENSPVQSIQLEPSSPTSSRLLVKLKNPTLFSSVLPKQNGGEIVFFSEIIGLKETKLKQGYSVKVMFKGNALYSLGFFDQPNRLVVDFTHTVSKLPNQFKTEFQHAPYSRIRNSQFQLNPAIARLVFDLKEKPVFDIKRGPHDVEFIFKTEKEEKKAPTIVKVVKPKQPKPLEGKLIVIDPGHGGDDPGALMDKHFFEKEYTLDISKRLYLLLTQLGAQVVMCRQGDQNPSLEERTKLANFNKTDVFISVHINSFITPFINGTETYYYKYKDEALAQAVHEELIKSLKLNDKGLKRARLYVLRNSTMPSVLIEPLFITNPAEFQLLSQPYFRQKIAGASARGIIKFLKEAPKPVKE